MMELNNISPQVESIILDELMLEFGEVQFSYMKPFQDFIGGYKIGCVLEWEEYKFQNKNYEPTKYDAIKSLFNQYKNNKRFKQVLQKINNKINA